MGTPKTCLLFITIQLIYAISAQEVVKRVPQGFVGMRGKKYLESTEQFYKRKPQFFVGVKGKKSIFDSSVNDDMYLKRAPMGFVGMRGKKEVFPADSLSYTENYDRYVPNVGGSLIGQIDYTTKENVKSSNNVDFPVVYELLAEFLQKLEHSDSMGSDTNKLSPQTDEEQSGERITNEVDKRAAFFGVRGKKSLQNKRPYDLSFRGKFIGVRGKKDMKNSGAQEIKFLLDQSEPWPKRKAQMGFFGMRGKKWISESSPEMETPN